MDFVAAIAGEISAVAAVAGFNKGDARIGEETGAGLGQNANKGVVLGMEDEGGNGNAVDDTGRGGAVIVVVGALETPVTGENFVVELADGTYRADAADSVDGRKEAGLAAEARHEPAQKIPLVKTIGGFVKGVGAGGEVDDGADRGDGGEQGIAAPLAGELENKVAAHGIADKGDAVQAEAGSIVDQNRAHIARETGVIQSGRESLSAAAVAHVHADDVAACGKGTDSYGANVTRVRRTLQTVNQDDGETRGADRFGLPVAMTQYTAAVGRIHLDRVGNGRQAKGGTGKVVGNDGLKMRVSEAAAGNERRKTRRQTGRLPARGGNYRMRSFRVAGAHGNSTIALGLLRSVGGLGRRVGIEPTTS